MSSLEQVGLVAIGRNEGDRLRQCLKSVVGKVPHIVYVDSGSTDGSVEFARSLGVQVVSLDLSIPFTAARSRNAGFEKLLEIHPQMQWVQFVDGDCEVVEGWLETAVDELIANPQLAVVCGRRRERFPDQSIYNLLCDIEWDTPVGDAKACGGDAMMRVTAFKQVGGFNGTLIAGEEPELCVRLRQAHWTIRRLDAEMTLHDANMLAFGQWWKRTLRAGHAYAEGVYLHGSNPERHWVKESRSIWLWGLLIPLIAFFFAWFTHGLSLLLLLGYPLQVLRIFQYACAQGRPLKAASVYAFFCVIGKFPNVIGQLKFHFNRLQARQSILIEYKGNT